MFFLARVGAQHRVRAHLPEVEERRLSVAAPRTASPRPARVPLVCRLAPWRAVMWAISWGQHPGHLGLGVGQGQQAAGKVDVAAGHREGVDDRGVEDGERISQPGSIRGGGKELADAVDVARERRIVVRAPELLEDLRMLVPPDALLVFRREAEERLRAGEKR